MKIRLKDIIDLDYLLAVDDALESDEDIRSRRIKDRWIYSQCKKPSQTGRTLLFSWLAFRKEEFFREQDKKGLKVLPGHIFSSLYTWMVYIAVFLGGICGISMAYSFLAYHGSRPINVAVFIAIFVVLQVILILLTLILLVRRRLSREKKNFSIIQTFITSLFFNVLPGLLQKAGLGTFKNSLDTLEYSSSFIRMKKREYKDLFFWPFFLLTSLFAFGFSAGAAGGTFFRVIVSDMAFGWQSTLMATSAKVHELVSAIALPWSWFMPQELAHPSLEQIEGSRIILKDGISVLATGDLVSWWPFLCMAILFYAVIPRGALILFGYLAQNHALEKFNVKRPRFTQLIVRMQSPVLDIDAGQTPAADAPPNQNQDDQDSKNQYQNDQNLKDSESENQTSVHLCPADEKKKTASPIKESDISSGKAVIIASKSVYTDEAIIKAIQQVEDHLFFEVKGAIGISFDFDEDTETVQRINKSGADQVILLHEVWQPPIRGLLHYITLIKAAMPRDWPLWILLTGDAGMENMSVDQDDINFEVWQKAVVKLENPDIAVKRFIEP